jgi:hypothetical protein
MILHITDDLVQGKDARRALRGTARCCPLGKCCHQVASPRTIKDVRTVLRSALHSAVRQELIDRNVAQLAQIPKQRKRKLDAVDQRGSQALPRIRPNLLRSALRRLRPGSVSVFAKVRFSASPGRPSISRRAHLCPTIAPTSPAIPSLQGNENRGIRCLAAHAGHRGRGTDDQAHTAGARTGGCRRDLAADERRAITCLHRALWHSDRPPHSQQEVHGARRCRRSACADRYDARHTCATLLVDLDVHPRVIMRILRHANQAVTMGIYANAGSTATREALRRLGDSLH